VSAVGLALAVSFSPLNVFAEVVGGDIFEDEASAPTDGRVVDQTERLSLAREAFLDGRRLMVEARWTEAALAFERAISAHSTPGLHYHLGLCLEQGGDVLRARQAYLDAQRLLEEQPATDVAGLLPEAIRRVEKRLSRFELVIVPERAAVWIDDVAVVETPPEWLAAGTHWLHAEAEGHEPLDRRFQAAPGAPTRLEIVLRPTSVVTEVAVAPPPLPQSVQPPPVVEPRPSLLPRTVFWGSITFAALGAAAGVAGVVWHVDSSARVEALQRELDDQGQVSDSACYGPAGETGDACQQLRAAVAAEESAAILLIGGFAAAGVGALGAVGSWALWPHEKFAVAGRVGLGSVRLELSGRF
jgi:hypothetical protein